MTDPAPDSEQVDSQQPADDHHRAVLERRRSNASGPHPLKKNKGSRAQRRRDAIDSSAQENA